MSLQYGLHTCLVDSGEGGQEARRGGTTNDAASLRWKDDKVTKFGTVGSKHPRSPLGFDLN